MKKEMLYDSLQDDGIDEKIISAMKKVPREKFISSQFIDEAYGDYPLPTLSCQTISQPTTVALMLQYLELKRGMKVLEIGSGSGWNTAIMAGLVGAKGKIFSLEIRKELAELAQKNISKMKMKNIKVINADGSKGWKYNAPYDRIIVTAAAPRIFDEWKEQLKEDGILVAPVGAGYTQVMVKAMKKHGELFHQNYGHFQFVEMKTDG